MNDIVAPIGAHSFHSGFGLKGGKRIRKQEIRDCVVAVRTLSKRIDRVAQWAAISAQANVQAVGLDREIEVCLPQFLDRLAARGIDRAQKFAGMVAFCGVDQSTLNEVVRRAATPYPIGRTQTEQEALIQRTAVAPKDLAKSDAFLAAIEQERRAQAELAQSFDEAMM